MFNENSHNRPNNMILINNNVAFSFFHGRGLRVYLHITLVGKIQYSADWSVTNSSFDTWNFLEFLF